MQNNNSKKGKNIISAFWSRKTVVWNKLNSSNLACFIKKIYLCNE